MGSQVTYQKTYPEVERIAGIAAETAATIAVSPLGERTAILALGALEAVNFRGGVESMVRDLTADKTFQYSDGSKNEIIHHGISTISNSISANGIKTDEVTFAGSMTTHKKFDSQGNLTGSTIYMNEGGVHHFDSSGKHQNSKCNIS